MPRSKPLIPTRLILLLFAVVLSVSALAQSSPTPTALDADACGLSDAIEAANNASNPNYDTNCPNPTGSTLIHISGGTVTDSN